MAALKTERDRLSRWRRARLTQHGYAADWRQFEAWCSRAGKVALPAEPETVELYSTWMLCEKRRKTTTTHRHLSSIAYKHRQEGLEDPVSAKARAVVCGARHERGERPVGKSAFSVKQIRKISKLLTKQGTHLALRNKALILLGVAAMLRRSEIGALRIEDLEFVSKGLLVHIRRSKGDQTLGIFRGLNADTCPVRTMREWLRAVGEETGFVFRRLPNGQITANGICGQTINNVVKDAAASIGLDPAAYGAHSLRASGITVAADEGASDLEIMDRSRHENIHVMRTYLRRSAAFAKRDPFRRAL